MLRVTQISDSLDLQSSDSSMGMAALLVLRSRLIFLQRIFPGQGLNHSLLGSPALVDGFTIYYLESMAFSLSCPSARVEYLLSPAGLLSSHGSCPGLQALIESFCLLMFLTFSSLIKFLWELTIGVDVRSLLLLQREGLSLGSFSYQSSNRGKFR